MAPGPKYAWKPKTRKFTPEQAMDVMALFDSGEKVNVSALSRKYGVTQRVIRQIKDGESYKEERRIYEKRKRETQAQAEAEARGRD